MVLYYAYGTPHGEFPEGARRAAIITEIDDPTRIDTPVGLCVLNPTGMAFLRHVPYARYPGDPGHWDWPPFVAGLSLPDPDPVAPVHTDWGEL
jgi:hypothetical protein